jgi:hypothetical protein
VYKSCIFDCHTNLIFSFGWVPFLLSPVFVTVKAPTGKAESTSTVVLSESLEHDTIVNVVKAKGKLQYSFMMLMFKLVFVFLIANILKNHGNIPKELQKTFTLVSKKCST